MEIATLLTLAAGLALAGSAFVPGLSTVVRIISAVLGLALAALAVYMLFVGATPGLFLWVIAGAFAVRNFRTADSRRRRGDVPPPHPGQGTPRKVQLPAWAPPVPGVTRPGIPAALKPNVFRGQAASYATTGQPPGHNSAPDTRGLRPAPPTDRWGKPIPPGSMMDRWGNIVPGE